MKVNVSGAFASPDDFMQKVAQVSRDTCVTLSISRSALQWIHIWKYRIDNHRLVLTPTASPCLHSYPRSQAANLHPIQTIARTMEAILAGQVGEGGAVVCVHGKLSSGLGGSASAIVTVRAVEG